MKLILDCFCIERVAPRPCYLHVCYLLSFSNAFKYVHPVCGDELYVSILSNFEVRSLYSLDFTSVVLIQAIQVSDSLSESVKY